jgi:hypothetical protein
MKSSHRAIVLLTALTLMLASPGVASAKPTSTYTLAYSQSNGVYSSSSRLTLDETGAGVLHFNETDFELITCADNGVGSVSSTYSVNGPVATIEFEVDRKLSAFYWRGSGEVTRNVTTYCPVTGLVSEAVTEQGIFEAVGASSSRLVRSRIDGARLLTSVLDSLTVETPTSSFNGAGTLTETISQG